MLFNPEVYKRQMTLDLGTKVRNTPSLCSVTLRVQRSVHLGTLTPLFLASSFPSSRLT